MGPAGASVVTPSIFQENHVVVVWHSPGCRVMVIAIVHLAACITQAFVLQERGWLVLRSRLSARQSPVPQERLTLSTVGPGDAAEVMHGHIPGHQTLGLA